MGRKHNYYERMDIIKIKHKQNKDKLKEEQSLILKTKISEEDILKIGTPEDNGYKESMKHAERLIGF